MKTNTEITALKPLRSRLFLASLGLAAVALLILIAIAAGPGEARAQETGRNRAAKEFMREKLELSKKVLEGITMENYDLIVSRATRLKAMSQGADWRVFENPEYDQQTAIFTRQVDSMLKAAKKKNLDGATLGYVQVTLRCVECHKLVRGKLVAQRSVGAQQFARRLP